jgi:hypothetical protein
MEGLVEDTFAGEIIPRQQPIGAVAMGYRLPST